MASDSELEAMYQRMNQRALEKKARASQANSKRCKRGHVGMYNSKGQCRECQRRANRRYRDKIRKEVTVMARDPKAGD